MVAVVTPPALPLLHGEDGNDMTRQQHGSALPKRRQNKCSVVLPPHILESQRSISGKSGKPVLRCNICRGECSGHNRRRFVDLHAACVLGKGSTCPKRILSKGEVDAVSGIAGVEMASLSGAKRRRLTHAAVI